MILLMPSRERDEAEDQHQLAPWTSLVSIHQFLEIVPKGNCNGVRSGGHRNGPLTFDRYPTTFGTVILQKRING
ncbi:hypothetical protein TNCV_122741 [Trichonephila clavipes]|nr:hypothetical protein TNCV_122741 [Trichonephila clavipes]